MITQENGCCAETFGVHSVSPRLTCGIPSFQVPWFIWPKNFELLRFLFRVWLASWFFHGLLGGGLLGCWAVTGVHRAIPNLPQPLAMDIQWWIHFKRNTSLTNPVIDFTSDRAPLTPRGEHLPKKSKQQTCPSSKGFQ